MLAENNIERISSKNVCVRFLSDSVQGAILTRFSELDKTAGTMKNWNCIRFGPNQPNEREARGHTNSRTFGE